jgi:hypothetical protein
MGSIMLEVPQGLIPNVASDIERVEARSGPVSSILAELARAIRAWDSRDRPLRALIVTRTVDAHAVSLALEDALGPDGPARPVVRLASPDQEMSLDTDFDVILTELAPDSLIQQVMGRYAAVPFSSEDHARGKAIEMAREGGPRF